jgi:hypothetical protein
METFVMIFVMVFSQPVDIGGKIVSQYQIEHDTTYYTKRGCVVDMHRVFPSQEITQVMLENQEIIDSAYYACVVKKPKGKVF